VNVTLNCFIDLSSPGAPVFSLVEIPLQPGSGIGLGWSLLLGHSWFLHGIVNLMATHTNG
jgi:hypothetical protein